MTVIKKLITVREKKREATAMKIKERHCIALFAPIAFQNPKYRYIASDINAANGDKICTRMTV